MFGIDWLKNLWIYFTDKMRKTIKKIAKILRGVGRKGIDIFLNEFWDFAAIAIQALIEENLSGAEKHQKVFDIIKTEAKKRGIYYKDNWINILIPTVYEVIKKEF